MILKLPDVRHDKQTLDDCGKTCALCVLEYYGLPASFAERLHPTPNGGVSPKELSDCLTLAGLSTVTGQWTIDMLKRVGVPVIVFINCPGGIDHYCLVSGVSRGRVRFFDPDDGNTSMAVEEFISRWVSIDKRGNKYIRGGIGVARS